MFGLDCLFLRCHLWSGRRGCTLLPDPPELAFNSVCAQVYSALTSAMCLCHPVCRPYSCSVSQPLTEYWGCHWQGTCGSWSCRFLSHWVVISISLMGDTDTVSPAWWWGLLLMGTPEEFLSRPHITTTDFGAPSILCGPQAGPLVSQQASSFHFCTTYFFIAKLCT